MTFERYTKGNQRLEDIATFLAKNGISTRSGKRISKTRTAYILANPFYVGLFNYAKELHEGKHEPIISKKLFDEAQEMLKFRGQPERKDMKCPEPCIRQEKLDHQLSSLIQKVSLPKDWTKKLLKMANKDFQNFAQSLTTCVKEKNEKISTISVRLERLLNGYLDQDIEKEIYRAEKGKLILQKKSLEEEISTFSHKQNDWLEPFTEWVKDAQNMDKIASDNNFFAKKVVAKEIFGSNLLLQNKSVRASAPKILNSFGKMGGNQWDALRASHLLASSKPLSSILVGREGFEPSKAEPTDLQSVPFDRSGICP